MPTKLNDMWFWPLLTQVALGVMIFKIVFISWAHK